MGKVLDILVGRKETLNTREYRSLDFSDSELKPQEAFKIGTAEINTESDLYKVEDALMSGQILIADVSTVTGNLSKEEVVQRLTETVNDVDGNISWRSTKKSELIVAPRGIEIKKSSVA